MTPPTCRARSGSDEPPWSVAAARRVAGSIGLALFAPAGRDVVLGTTGKGRHAAVGQVALRMARRCVPAALIVCLAACSKQPAGTTAPPHKSAGVQSLALIQLSDHERVAGPVGDHEPDDAAVVEADLVVEPALDTRLKAIKRRHQRLRYVATTVGTESSSGIRKLAGNFTFIPNGFSWRESVRAQVRPMGWRWPMALHSPDSSA